MERSNVIKNLSYIMDSMPDDACAEWRDSLAYAINSLKTDEMYQLMYEGITPIIASKGMTNGDIIKLLYPNLSIITDTTSMKSGEEVVVLQSIGTVMVCLKGWWDAQYKENEDAQNLS